MRNSIWGGVALGLCGPLVAYLLTKFTGAATFISSDKPYVLYVVAAAVNLFLIRFFYKGSAPREQVAKGIVLATFGSMLVFLYFHKLQL